MLNRELEETLSAAFRAARDQRHEFMTVEHLLLALLDNREAAEVLHACGVDFDRMRAQLAHFIDETTPRLPDTLANLETQPTLGFQRVLQRAVFHVQSSGKQDVSGANVLVAIFSEQESHAVYVLTQQGVERVDVVNYISHGISKVGEAPSQTQREDEGEAGEAADKSQSALSQYAVNLNQQAALGRIDPLVGRDQEIERVVQILSRRRKNNPLLVGEAGSAKRPLQKAWLS